MMATSQPKIRTRSRKLPKCHYCTRPGTLSCDFPEKLEPVQHPPLAEKGATWVKPCAKLICGQCAVHPTPDKDECRVHAWRKDVRA